MKTKIDNEVIRTSVDIIEKIKINMITLRITMISTIKMFSSNIH
jgi:hypothetical protein